MNNFFRKYGKWMLPVLGVVLMILWLGPQPGSGGGNGAKVTIGDLNGTEVTNADLDQTKFDLELLMNVRRAGFQVYGGDIARQLRSFGIHDRLDPDRPDLHFFLLQHEARNNYNLTASELEVDDVLRQIPRDILQTAGLVDSRPLREAIRHALVVEKLDNLALPALEPSLPEIKQTAADMGSRAAARYVLLNAQNVPPGAPEPTAAEIAAHFDRYKNVLPETARTNPPEIDGHRFPFGYKMPDRVRVEFLEFDRAAVRDLVLQRIERDNKRNDLIIAAYEEYQKNPERFANDDDEPATAPATGPATATRPAIKPFHEVQQILVDEQVDLRAEKLIKQMTDAALLTLQKPWTKLNEQGLKERAPNVPAVAYEAVADDIQRRFGYRPTVRALPNLLNARQLADLKGIGNAAAILGNNTRLPFYQLAMNVRELVEKPGDGILRSQQVMVEGPFVKAPDAGLTYIYRVTEAQKAHVPETVEPVRNEVVRDLQRLAAYRQYQKQAAELRAKAAQSGLPAAADPAGQRVVTIPPFSRQTFNGYSFVQTPIPGISRPGPVADAIFDLAAASKRAAATSTAPATTPASDATHQVAVVNLDQDLQIVVAELTDFQPMPVNQFDNINIRLLALNAARWQHAPTFAAKWNGLRDVASRVKFVPVVPFQNNDNG